MSLAASDFARLSAVLLFPRDSASISNHDRASKLFRSYTNWEARHFQLEEDPFQPVDLSGTRNGIPVLGSGDALASKSMLDVIIAFDDPDVSERRIASSTRFGLMFVEHGANASHRTALPYFSELYEREPVNRTVVKLLRGEDECLLAELFSATELGWSWRQNASVPYWRAAAALLHALEQLHMRGLQSVSPAARKLASPRHAITPTNAQMLRFLARNAVRTVWRRARYSNLESFWFVAYRSNRAKFISDTEKFDPAGLQAIEAEPGRFYADPFPFCWKNRTYLFVEDYSFAQRRGCISVLEMDTSGPIGPAQRVLETPYHLSYPFVFEHGGEVYMIPETSEAGRIELYKSREFPAHWERAAVLRDNVRAVDTTVHHQDGLFFFFTNIAERGVTVNDNLFLFYSETLSGDWKPHPANPIVTDVRRSRGAGKLFLRNGKLIRPSQDCSVRYGYACTLNEIDVLSPDEYCERPVQRIEPNWRPRLIGTHTVNHDETIEVIDGLVYRSRSQTQA